MLNLPSLRKKGGRLRTVIRKRPSALPTGWLKITDGKGIRNFTRLRDWQLVLNSIKIPYYLSRFQEQYHIYVPFPYAIAAKRELDSYTKENQHAKKPALPWLPHKNAWLVLPALAPLIFIHLFSRGWHFSAVPFLPAGNWVAYGCLDKAKVILDDQWYRALTALSLHNGIEHLYGNLFLGGLFIFLLARMTGAGAALFLAVFSGALGNLGSLLVHTFTYKSIGFSTAIFGCLGAMAAIMAVREKTVKKMLLPVGAILGLLGLLGTEGEKTDYTAHIMGLMAGLATGAVYAWFVRRGLPTALQAVLGITAIGAMTLAWLLAFSINSQ